MSIERKLGIWMIILGIVMFLVGTSLLATRGRD